MDKTANTTSCANCEMSKYKTFQGRKYEQVKSDESVNNMEQQTDTELQTNVNNNQSVSTNARLIIYLTFGVVIMLVSLYIMFWK